MVAAEIYSYVQANLLTRILFFGGMFVLAAMLLLYYYQDKMLYIPQIQGISKHSSGNPVGYRDPSDRLAILIQRAPL